MKKWTALAVCFALSALLMGCKQEVLPTPSPSPTASDTQTAGQPTGEFDPMQVVDKGLIGLDETALKAACPALEKEEGSTEYSATVAVLQCTARMRVPYVGGKQQKIIYELSLGDLNDAQAQALVKALLEQAGQKMGTPTAKGWINDQMVTQPVDLAFVQAALNNKSQDALCIFQYTFAGGKCNVEINCTAGEVNANITYTK